MPTQRYMAREQAAILNALPAHIALLNSQGLIVSVNEAWRRFADANGFPGPGHGTGINYLEVCDQAQGNDSSEAHQIAAGIRAVLGGAEKSFSIEYPCHSPNEPRWFLLAVTPLVAEDRPNGAVVMHLNITERRRDEESLRASQSNLAAAQRLAHFGSWELELTHSKDVPARALRWSDEMFRIAGYEPGAVAVSNEWFFHLVPPEDREPIRQAVATAIRERREYSIAHRLIRPNGETRVLQETGQIVFDEKTGQPLKIIGTAHDITERKRAEQVIERGLQRLNEAQRIGQIGDWDYDLATQAITWSPQVFEILGRDPRLGPPGNYEEMTALFDAASQALMKEKVALAIKAGETQDYELQSPRPNGTLVDVLGRGVPRKNERGKVVGLVGTVQDITARKRSEAALKDSEARYYSLFENMMEGYAYCQTLFEQDQLRDFTYVEVNSAFERLTGLKNVVGKKVSEVIPGIYETSPELFAVFSRVALTGKPKKFETYLKSLGIWFSITAYSQEREHFIAVFDNITERKHAEAALRTSEAEFRALAEAMPQMIWVTRPDGWCIYFSRQWMDYTGLTLEESLGHGWIKPFHPDDQQRAWDAWQHATTTIDAYSVECRLRRADGAYRWWLMRGVPQMDAAGNLLKWFGTCTDIHDLKEAELEISRTNRELRESDEKFHQLADHITDAFWIRSPDLSEVHYLSPAFERIWGRSVASLYANPQEWADFILPEDRERVLGSFAALTGDTRNLDIEYRIVRPDGGIRWVRVRGFQVRDNADKLICHTGIVTDITVGKQNEISALAFSKLGQRLSSAASAREAFEVIKGISKELFGWDAFTLRLYNAKADSFYAGFMIDTIAGQEVAEEQTEPLKPGPLYRRVIAQGGELILRGPRPTFGPGMVPFGDVSHPSASLMFVPIRSRGHGVGVLSVQSYAPHAYQEQDLQTLQTMADQCGGAIERIWADEALRKAEAQLFQSQKMETVGKLAGGVAHEFNSILTAIIGQSELLLADLPPESPLIGNAAEISKAAGRAATLTRQLLAYGRKQFLQPAILDLNAVLAGMESTLRHLMGRAVDVRLAPAAGLKAVKADAGQLEQVIMNLAMNARDAMPNGGKLTLETANVSFDAERVAHYPELQAGDYVMLAITDTGTGMSEEVKRRVFDPFFSTKGVGRGTGLGLPTCYGIIKQSGGHISVYSEPGRGTTVKIYLPHAEAPAPLNPVRLDSPELPRGSETVLLVENDPALREMAATLLRRLGYKILSAANGVEALNLQSERSTGPIDLLFTDVVMPHLSGPELADRVRALSPRTRILFTSAYTEKAIVHQGVLDPGVALLQKPFSPSALAHKLREVLDSPGAPA